MVSCKVQIIVEDLLTKRVYPGTSIQGEDIDLLYSYIPESILECCDKNNISGDIKVEVTQFFRMLKVESQTYYFRSVRTLDGLKILEHEEE
jgi:hypothetical protein